MKIKRICSAIFTYLTYILGVGICLFYGCFSLKIIMNHKQKRGKSKNLLFVLQHLCRRNKYSKTTKFGTHQSIGKYILNLFSP